MKRSMKNENMPTKDLTPFTYMTLAVVVIIVKVRSSSPLFGSFQESHRPASAKGSPLTPEERSDAIVEAIKRWRKVRKEKLKIQKRNVR